VLLEERRKIYGEGERTAWNFERHRDKPADPVLEPLLRSCFRISGKYFLKQPGNMKLQMARESIERFLIDVMLYAVKKRRGVSVRQKLEKNLLWRYGHYLGPYPLFWSGLMQQGKPHQGFEKWVCTSGDQALQREWNELKNHFEA
jgi:hypothetical protein